MRMLAAKLCYPTKLVTSDGRKLLNTFNPFFLPERLYLIYIIGDAYQMWGTCKKKNVWNAL